MGDTSSPSSAEIASISAKIMIATIVVVFLLMLLLFCVHFYLRCSWSSNHEDPSTVSWRRREARRGRAAAVAAQRRGLDPLALGSIPVVVYDPKDFKDGLECAVCLSEVSQGEKARILPKCNHGFHVDCIDMWFHSHSTCPLCRSPVVQAQYPSLKPNNRANNGVGLSHVSPSDSSSSDDDDDDDDDASYANTPSMEEPNFPTNVLVWGNETQVRSLDGEGTSSSAVNRSRDDELVIQIPMREFLEDCLSASSPLPLSTTVGGDEEAKTPVVSRLRSFKRLLSRGKRVAPSPRASSSADAEQV